MFVQRKRPPRSVLPTATSLSCSHSGNYACPSPNDVWRCVVVSSNTRKVCGHMHPSAHMSCLTRTLTLKRTPVARDDLGTVASILKGMSCFIEGTEHAAACQPSAGGTCVMHVLSGRRKGDGFQIKSFHLVCSG